MIEFLIFIILAAGMAAAGYFIGNTKGRGGLGVILGLFLGPIGWVIVLLLPAQTNNALPADYIARRNSSRYGTSPERRAKDEAWKRAQLGE
jgi:hypothetical protein